MVFKPTSREAWVVTAVTVMVILALLLLLMR